jgi:hypothetical protein
MSPVDEFASPGPARLVDVELSNGHRASVVFHERKQLVEILAPLEVGVEAGLAGLLFELSIPPEALTWTHARIDLRVLLARVMFLKERERDHRERPMALRSRSSVTTATALQRKSMPIVDEVESFNEAGSVAVGRKTRSDIKVSTLERKLGLKSGAIRNPDGSDARSDKRLSTLRKDQRKHK